MAQTFETPPRRRVRTVAAVLIVAAGVLPIVAAVDVDHVRHAYGVWALWPGARTPRLPFDGRDYLRSDPPGVILDAGNVSLGSAPGGGEIFSLPAIDGAVPTVLYVRYPDGTLTVYALSGGP